MTDSELSLALARAMKLSQCMLLNNGGVVYLGEIDGLPGRKMQMPFDPIHNGEDFDAVLMWAHERSDWLSVVVSDEFTGSFGERNRPYSEFRRAVCEAVVEEAVDAEALGGAG